MASVDRPSVVDAVVIGRNEGARLVACLTSMAGAARRIVYVDSGSTDGSPEAARAAGAEVVMLDLAQPFTAARARNAGLAALPEGTPEEGEAYVQFVDGDCALREGWLEAARGFLDANPAVAVVCGRRRERHPEASIYNHLCDLEWDTPVGEALACGGDALMRRNALLEVGGYRDGLIAGEEPELCLRLRARGWKIWRIGQEMTWHDAAITRFGQWWRRTRRAGHAFAEGAALHGGGPQRHWVAETRRALVWGLGVPVAALLAMVLVGPWGALVLLAWPAQAVRLAWRNRALGARMALAVGVFSTLCKIPEMLGVLEYHLKRRFGRASRIIEYK